MTSLPSGAAERNFVLRRIGYGLAATVNAVCLLFVKVRPGWRAIPFVTDDASSVIPLVNAALVTGVVAAVLQMSVARRALRAAAEIVTSSVSIILIARVLAVFPFSCGDPAVDWASIVRVALGFAIDGCLVSVVVQVVALLRLRLLSGEIHGRADGPG